MLWGFSGRGWLDEQGSGRVELSSIGVISFKLSAYLRPDVSNCLFASAELTE